MFSFLFFLSTALPLVLPPSSATVLLFLVVAASLPPYGGLFGASPSLPDDVWGCGWCVLRQPRHVLLSHTTPPVLFPLSSFFVCVACAPCRGVSCVLLCFPLSSVVGFQVSVFIFITTTPTTTTICCCCRYCYWHYYITICIIFICICIPSCVCVFVASLFLFDWSLFDCFVLFSVIATVTHRSRALPLSFLLDCCCASELSCFSSSPSAFRCPSTRNLSITTTANPTPLPLFQVHKTRGRGHLSLCACVSVRHTFLCLFWCCFAVSSRWKLAVHLSSLLFLPLSSLIDI
jgi:hypothetical protein